MDESGTDDAEYRRKMVSSGRKVAGAIWSLVKTRSLQFECAKVLHEAVGQLYGEKMKALELGLRR